MPARAGQSIFGAGHYKPGDDARAHLWLLRFAGINPKHPDMSACYRTDVGVNVPDG